MKLNSIINRYIFKEFIPPFFINIVFLIFVFLMAKILNIMNMVINYEVGLWEILQVILYSIPYFLVFITPISTMLSILLTFMRMSGDNEVIALRSGGVSIYSLLVPVFCFCIITTGLTFGMAFYGTPWGRLALKELTHQVAVSSLKAGLKERVFNTKFKDITLYVTDIDMATKELVDVFVEDRRTHNLVNTIVAPRGNLISTQDGTTAIVQLFDGTINQVNLKDRSVNSIKFGSYDFKLALPSPKLIKKGARKKHVEMYLSDFKHYFKHSKQKDLHYYSLLTKYYNRYAIAFSCISLGLLAVPLGVLSTGLKGSLGVVMGVLFLILYNSLMSVGKMLCETGDYPPSIVMWIPNAVILLITAYFFHRSADNRTFDLSWFHRFKNQIIRKSPNLL